MLRLLVLAGLLAVFGACSTYKIGYRNTAASPGATHEVKQNFLLWGLVGGQEVELDQLCGGNVAEIRSQRSVVDGLLMVITGGLYSPMSVEVQCASTSAQADQGADDELAEVSP